MAFLKKQIISCFALYLFVSTPAHASFGDDGIVNCKAVANDFTEVCEISKKYDVNYSTLSLLWKRNLHIEISNTCNFIRTEPYDPETMHKYEEGYWEQIENLPDGPYAENIASEMYLSLLEYLVENDGFPEHKKNPKMFCSKWKKVRSEVYIPFEDKK